MELELKKDVKVVKALEVVNKKKSIGKVPDEKPVGTFTEKNAPSVCGDRCTGRCVCGSL